MSSSSSSPSHHLLAGSCSCGRNQYTIPIPRDQTHLADVYFDNAPEGRKTNGAPITAYLRVPLDWYTPTTHAYASTETPSQISRVFAADPSSSSSRSARRTFCGFCGTPLTYWAEKPRGEEKFISVTVGSLRGRDQRRLEELGVLPEAESSDEEEEEEVGERKGKAHEDDDDDDDVEVVQGEVEDADDAGPAHANARSGAVARRAGEDDDTLLRAPRVSTAHRTGTSAGIPWFEDMIHGSRLGRTQRMRRGQGEAPDDSAKMQWEVREWNDDGSGGDRGSGSGGGRGSGRGKGGGKSSRAYGTQRSADGSTTTMMSSSESYSYSSGGGSGGGGMLGDMGMGMGMGMMGDGFGSGFPSLLGGGDPFANDPFFSGMGMGMGGFGSGFPGFGGGLLGGPSRRQQQQQQQQQQRQRRLGSSQKRKTLDVEELE